MTRVRSLLRLVSFLLPVLLLAASPVRGDTLYGVAQQGGGPTSPSTLYRINPINGVATPIGPIGFNAVGGIDFQPVTDILYGVGKNGSGTDVLITIDIKTGIGTEVGTLAGVDTAGAGGLFDVSFRNSDRVLFLAALDDPEVGVYTVDLETAAATAVGNTGFEGSGNGFGFSLSDALFLTSGSNLISVNPGTGVGTTITTFSFAGFPLLTGPSLTALEARPADGVVWVAVNDGSMASGPNYLATLNTVTGTVGNRALSVNGLTGLAWLPDRPVVPDGLLFGAARAGGETSASTLYSIDPATGSSAAIGPIGFNGIGGMDFHPTTKQLLGVAKRTGDDIDVLIEINPATGAGTEIGALVNVAPVAGGLDLSFRPDGALYLAASMPGNNVGLYSVNQNTGEATLVGDTLAAGSGNGLGYAPDGTLHFYSGSTLYEVNDVTAATSSPTVVNYIGFPTLTNARIAAIDYSPSYKIPFAAVDDGTAGSGPNYLAYFDASTSATFNIGRTIDGLIALAWRPARDTCGTLVFGAARTGSGFSPSVFYEIDPSTGAALPLGQIGFNEVRGLAMEPKTRRLFAVGRRFFDDEPVLIEIDTATGAGSEVGPLNNTGPFANHFDLGFRRGDGTLFMLAQDSLGATTLFTVDLTTGEATAVGATTTASAGNGLVFDLDDTLFHADDAAGGTLRTVDAGTGVSSSGATLTYAGFPALNGPEPNALAVDHATGTTYVAVDDGSGASGPNYFATLDTATATATHVGATVNGLDALEVYAGCDDLDPCSIDTCQTCQQLLYGASHRGGAFGASTLRFIDPATGESVPVGPIGFNDVNAMDFHPATGVLYAVGRRTVDGVSVLISINPRSAQAREIGPLLNTNGGFSENHFDLSFRGSTNVLYLEARDSAGDVTLFTINPATGVATVVGNTGTTGSDHGIAFSSGDVLYQGDDTSGGTLATVNPATGAASFLSALTYNGFPTLVAPRPNAIDFDLCDPNLAVISIDDGTNGQGPNYLGTLDITTGTVTYIGTAFSGLDALAWRDVTDSYCTRYEPGDTDTDTVCDPIDNCPLIFNTNQADFDMDDIGNPCDIDDDNDGVNDGADSDQFNRFVCRDVEPDTCDDCSSGFDDPANDGPDADGEGICDAGDNCDQDPNLTQDNFDGDALGDVCDPDDDNDGVDDGMDSAQFDAFVCRDVDADTCDDCSFGTDDVANDGTDTDGDGLCDAGDPDDDNDGVDDGIDSDPFNQFVCRDLDADGCDDCSSGMDNVANDGLDTDGDGACNAGDPDDDNDSVPDGMDLAPQDQFACRDLDADSCDDCSSGTDNPGNDGTDTDIDGICDAGDNCPLNANANQANYDGDSQGDVCDLDDDNDGVNDGADSDQFNQFVCRDLDADSCDDCSSGTVNPLNDGIDTDGEGICDAGDNCPGVANLTQENFDGDTQGDACDPDDDNDNVDDVDDWEPFLNTACRDADRDTCDDCVSGTDNPADDGTDTDGEGICDAGDNCVNHPNPGQESPFYFPETVVAQTKDLFSWTTPTDIVYAVGIVPNLPAYTTGAIDYRAARTQFVVGDPPPNTIRWYLVRVDCPVGSWASGGANECPDAKGCPNGGRDANLP